MLTLDELCNDLKKMTEQIGTGLAPDDDWAPVFATYEGSHNMLCAIPQIGEPAMKAVLCEQIIPELIARSRARFASLVTTAWMKSYDVREGLDEQQAERAVIDNYNAERAEHDKGQGLGDVPGRKEVLSILVGERDGDLRQLLAYVHRHDGMPPTLEWMDDDLLTETTGLFPSAFRKGFALDPKTLGDSPAAAIIGDSDRMKRFQQREQVERPTPEAMALDMDDECFCAHKRVQHRGFRNTQECIACEQAGKACPNFRVRSAT